MLRRSGGTVANLSDRWPSLTAFSPLSVPHSPSDSTELSPHSRTPAGPSHHPLEQLFREVSKSLSACRPSCSRTSHSECWLSDMSPHWTVNHMILLSPHICACFISESLCLSAVILLQFAEQSMLYGPHLGRGSRECPEQVEPGALPPQRLSWRPLWMQRRDIKGLGSEEDILLKYILNTHGY